MVNALLTSKSLSISFHLAPQRFRFIFLAPNVALENMDEHLSSIMEQAKRKLADQESAVLDSKKFINQLCQFGGAPPLYKLDEEKSSGLGIGAIQSDTFYGKSATTAVREFLEMRKASGMGAASHTEIIQALQSGGFDFSTLSPDDAIAQRTVAITMGKNSSIFHKLPNGNWGLMVWYPDAKERKKKVAVEQPKLVDDPAENDLPGTPTGTKET